MQPPVAVKFPLLGTVKKLNEGSAGNPDAAANLDRSDCFVSNELIGSVPTDAERSGKLLNGHDLGEVLKIIIHREVPFCIWL